VQHADYQIANVNVIDKLLPNNYTVDAYYLPDSVGLIGEVFLYQNGVFVCKANKIPTYNEANAEWTDKDKESYTEQAKYVSEFDHLTKQGKRELSTPVIVQSKMLKEAIEVPATIIEAVVNKQEGVDELIEDHNNTDYSKQAIDNL
jgi:hypothetical protein